MPVSRGSSQPRDQPQVSSTVGKFNSDDHRYLLEFPGSSDGKESTCNVDDLELIPGLGRSPGGGHGNPLQYSCLENSMDRGAWWATVDGSRKESDMTE